MSNNTTGKETFAVGDKVQVVPYRPRLGGLVGTVAAVASPSQTRGRGGLGLSVSFPWPAGGFGPILVSLGMLHKTGGDVVMEMNANQVRKLPPGVKRMVIPSLAQEFPVGTKVQVVNLRGMPLNGRKGKVIGIRPPTGNKELVEKGALVIVRFAGGPNARMGATPGYEDIDVQSECLKKI